MERLSLFLSLFTVQQWRLTMKFTFPGIVLTVLAASPAALAQNTNYTGSTSKPGASFQKDDTTTSVTKTSKKHMASHKKKHQAKAMNSKAMKSKAQSTGSGSSSAPGASFNKDDTTPKSKQ
ncbi:MAG: hypothetical protein WAN94_03110 [Pseudolabrys sp.]